MPTTVDTVTVALVFTLTTNGTLTPADRTALRVAVADKLVAQASIHNWAITSSQVGRRRRRQLLSTFEAEVTCDIKVPLAATGVSAGSSYAEAVLAEISNPVFVSELRELLSVVVSALSAVDAEALSRAPTGAPSLAPTASLAPTPLPTAAVTVLPLNQTTYVCAQDRVRVAWTTPTDHHCNPLSLNLVTAGGNFVLNMDCERSNAPGEVVHTHDWSPDSTVVCPGRGATANFAVLLRCSEGYGDYYTELFAVTGAASTVPGDDDRTPAPTLTLVPTGVPSPSPTPGCSLGEYLSSSKGCVACPEGSFGDRTVPPWLCSPCAQGFFQPNTGKSSCLPCPVGSYSSDDGRFCISCQPGEFVTDLSRCASCPAATYAPVPLNGACSECSNGFYTGALNGATTCTKCDEGTGSSSSRLACDVAAPDYFIASSGEITPCPAHAVCDGGTAMPRPEPGYWVDRRELENALFVYACPRETCTGGRSRDESCWDARNYNSTACFAQEEILCSEGAHGILCMSCEDSYTFNSALSQCLLCEGNDNRIPLIIFGIVVLAAIICAVLYANGYRFPEWVMDLHVVITINHVEKGHLKVAWVSAQPPSPANVLKAKNYLLSSLPFASLRFAGNIPDRLNDRLDPLRSLP